MDILTQTSLFLSVLCLALGASVVARNPRDKLHWSYGLICLAIFLWAIFFVLSRTLGGRVFYDFHLLFNIWIVPAGLLVIRYLISEKASFNRFFLWTALALGSLFSVALIFNFQQQPWVRSVIYFFPVIMVVQILVLMIQELILVRAPSNRPMDLFLTYQKKLWIYGGALAVLSMTSMDHVPQSGVIGPSLGNLALCVYLFFMSQVVTQQKFLNLGLLGARFGVMFILAWILTGLYLLVVAWIKDSFALFLLNSFIVSFLVVTLLNPMLMLIKFLTRSFASPQIRRLEQLIRVSERQVSRLTDEKALRDHIRRTFSQIFDPAYLGVYFLKAELGRYEWVESESESPSEGSDFILAQHPLILECAERLLTRENAFLLVEDLQLEMDRSASRAERESLGLLIDWIQGLGGNLILPLVDSRKILGFVIVRVEHPPRGWGDNWSFLTLVYGYCRIVGRAMMALESFTKEKDKDRLAVLGQMAAGLAHEIRNPLGAIKGAAQFLDPTKNSPEAKFLKVIIEEVDRLNRVVTQFLEYSRPKELLDSEFDLGEVVRNGVEFSRPGLPSQVRLELVASPPIHVKGDADQMRQVVLNLVQNAAKALHESQSVEPLIQVSVGTEGGSGSVPIAWIRVRDNGPGINDSDQKKVFIPFFTTSPSGTGLGLSISQKILESHGGKISFTSDVKKGTEFKVELPAISKQPQPKEA